LTLTDSFEWAKDHARRLGIVEIDYGTPERRLRQCCRARQAMLHNAS